MSGKIYDLLMKRAGLDRAMVQRGSPDASFDEIVSGMLDIHKGKEALYGNYLETHGKEPTAFALMEHFSDLKRKYVRAETFVRKIVTGQDIPLEELLDTYSDLAVYGAIGVQLVLFKLGMIEDVRGRSSPPAANGTGGERPVRDRGAGARGRDARAGKPLETLKRLAGQVPQKAPRANRATSARNR